MQRIRSLQTQARKKRKITLQVSSANHLNCFTLQKNSLKKIYLEKNKSIQDALKNVEQKLNSKGRVLLRPSGTEPKIRVMVEGEDIEAVKNHANFIADRVREVV